MDHGYLYASTDTTVFRWPFVEGGRDPLADREIVVSNIPTGGRGGVRGPTICIPPPRVLAQCLCNVEASRVFSLLLLTGYGLMTQLTPSGSHCTAPGAPRQRSPLSPTRRRFPGPWRAHHTHAGLWW